MECNTNSYEIKVPYVYIYQIKHGEIRRQISEKYEIGSSSTTNEKRIPSCTHVVIDSLSSVGSSDSKCETPTITTVTLG